MAAPAANDGRGHSRGLARVKSITAADESAARMPPPVFGRAEPGPPPVFSRSRGGGSRAAISAAAGPGAAGPPSRPLAAWGMARGEVASAVVARATVGRSMRKTQHRGSSRMPPTAQAAKGRWNGRPDAPVEEKRRGCQA
eukprot:scaffold12706_cov90-Isochrysis_galbana.AAC.3